MRASRVVLLACATTLLLATLPAEAGVIYRGTGEGWMPDGMRLTFSAVTTITGTFNQGAGTAELSRPGVDEPTRIVVSCFGADYTGYGFLFRASGHGEDGRQYYFAGNSQNATFLLREIPSPDPFCPYDFEYLQIGQGSFSFESLVL